MNQPEHVYPAILLQLSVNSDKSGVLVTTGLEPASSNTYTVVANEGVGGGVDGQSAEMLTVNPADGSTRLIFSATAPLKRVLLPSGGSALRRASGSQRVLTQQDVAKLLGLVARTPNWFGSPDVVADIEFGFEDERLVLFQIRPFVDNENARKHAYLASLDAALARHGDARVALSEPGR